MYDLSNARDACSNKAVNGQRVAQDYIGRLGNWDLFEWPISFQHIAVKNLKFLGWIQLTCGFIELFWSSCVLLDMHYHSNDWRAYFTMCTVSWQFISIILISMKCPLLERIINGQRNRISAEISTATVLSSCNVDLRIAKLPEEIDSRTAKDVSDLTVNKISDLKATKEQNDKQKGSEGRKE
uniref:Uncharacterized protein n=1 Tax=Wuchereria bancrofti TaxID=6293 RepID=A0A1I8EGJ0_WUCBA